MLKIIKYYPSKTEWLHWFQLNARAIVICSKTQNLIMRKWRPYKYVIKKCYTYTITNEDFFISWNASLPTEATHDSALHLKCQLRGPIGYRRCMYNLYGAFINMNPILNPNTDSINDVPKSLKAMRKACNNTLRSVSSQSRLVWNAVNLMFLI